MDLVRGVLGGDRARFAADAQPGMARSSGQTWPKPDEIHQRLVDTLGNLTLTAFNGTLSNNPFERKRQIYGASHLELNRALAEQDVWGRDQILARADVLADHAIAIWPSPLPGRAAPP